ncbi:unnamed protein product [Pleuronectes platessa]|uniref:Uncharacterized protein n=1 Tax=Pleuronectes platessa TaxID=8262 RepID=A0A9N7UAU8_PLEPL|nr:unnamed protein product [Pleuronectes platessa]
MTLPRVSNAARGAGGGWEGKRREKKRREKSLGLSWGSKSVGKSMGPSGSGRGSFVEIGSKTHCYRRVLLCDTCRIPPSSHCLPARIVRHKQCCCCTGESPQVDRAFQEQTGSSASPREAGGHVAFTLIRPPPHLTHSPPSPCLPPTPIMHGEIKARQARKVTGQKFEPKKREKEKRENGGSLSCGALPLKASWPAICAGSLAIATTPGREREERGSQGRREGGKDGGKVGDRLGT